MENNVRYGLDLASESLQGKRFKARAKSGWEYVVSGKVDHRAGHDGLWVPITYVAGRNAGNTVYIPFHRALKAQLIVEEKPNLASLAREAQVAVREAQTFASAAAKQEHERFQPNGKRYW
jgi:hypothetical protein